MEATTLRTVQCPPTERVLFTSHNPPTTPGTIRENLKDPVRWGMESSQEGCYVTIANNVSKLGLFISYNQSNLSNYVVNEGPQIGPPGSTPPAQEKQPHGMQYASSMLASHQTGGHPPFMLCELPEPPIPVSEIGPIPPPPMFSSPSPQPRRPPSPLPNPADYEGYYDYEG